MLEKSKVETVQTIDTQTTQIPIPPKGQRGDYHMIFTKKPTEPGTLPSGGNFSLEDILKGTEEAKEALPTKADKAVEKGLFLDVDNPVFRVDGSGVPFPGQQKAVIKAQKKYIDGTLHWDVHGKQIPDGTEQIEVDINEMVSEGIVLKNSITINTADWITNISYNAPIGDKFEVLANHKYFIHTKCKAKSGIDWGKHNDPHLSLYSKGKEFFVKGVKDNSEQVLSMIQSITETDSQSFVTCWSYPFDSFGSMDVKETVCIDITDLSTKYPQFTDEQLKTILDASLPYISAQQSVNLGGAITLENVLPNPTSADDWSSGADVTNFSKTGTIVQGTTTRTRNSGASYTIYRRLRGIPSDKYYVSFEELKTTNNLSIAVGYDLVVYKNGYKPFAIVNGGSGGDFFVASGSDSRSTITFDTSKGINIVPLKTSLLDLWLSLNGYSTDEQKADWCNEHIPPFEGTYDLVLAINQELPVVVTCGNYSASTRIEVVENLNSLINLHTHIGKIERDGKETSDKLITLDQEVTKQGGTLQVLDKSHQLYTMGFKPKDLAEYLHATGSTPELKCKDAFAKLKALVATGNFDGLNLGDYIYIPTLKLPEVPEQQEVLDESGNIVTPYMEHENATTLTSSSSYTNQRVQIVGFNHYWSIGSSTNIRKPHVVMEFAGVPQTHWFNRKVKNPLPPNSDGTVPTTPDPWNYKHWDYWTKGDYNKSQLRAWLEKCFGSALIEAIGYDPIPIDRLIGTVGSWAWTGPEKVFLPTNLEVLGNTGWATRSNGYSTGTSRQYALHAMNPATIMHDRNGSRYYYWLAEPQASSSVLFSSVYNYGFADSYSAYYPYGVAPAFLIG